ncbi:hypothetical protein NP493_1623g00036 [Ridgeia piscesae]|uniref:Fibrinogen C-terminal domain-containing protein n=1 Tax=Ridgeia piscesae TaxID=27915 RepID=A0AAD9N9X2_RIDPI|nr:hypothetical protein NP493_1623g00036 [Ridgeia piscesae]
MEAFNGETRFAEYVGFSIDAESSYYTLRYSTYLESSSASDCLGMHKDLPFSTKDADHDFSGSSCSIIFYGAWWYRASPSSNLNGRYYQEGEDPVYATGLIWKTWTGLRQSLKTVTMKFTPGLFPGLPILNPPVTTEVMRRLIDANTDTCLSLASTDMYTFSALSNRWNLPFIDMCWFEGLVIQAHVPYHLKASFTVRITGHGLVCDNSYITVMVRRKKSPPCPTAGEYYECKLSRVDHGGLTTCVAKCLCEGKDCKRATIQIPEMHEDWDICEISVE